MATPRYDGPEHESLRAVARCLVVNYGRFDGHRRVYRLLNRMGVSFASELSPFGANYCRKHLEKQLPIRGDYA